MTRIALRRPPIAFVACFVLACSLAAAGGALAYHTRFVTWNKWVTT